MLTWAPLPAIVPWQDVQEDEVWTASVSASDPLMLAVVTGYEWVFVGDPLPALVITAGASGLTVSAPNTLAGLLPPIDIEYQVPGGDVPPFRITRHCQSFAELPDDLTDVISYQPNPASNKSFTLRVTALTTLGTDSADFVIRVWTNYTTGKNSMLEAINASR